MRPSMKTSHLILSSFITLVVLMGCDSSSESSSSEETYSVPIETVSEERTVELTFILSESSAGRVRSLAKTALGTFEDISSLYVNLSESGKSGKLYSGLGVALSKGNGSSWGGKFEKLTVNKSYAFEAAALNASNQQIFTGTSTFEIKLNPSENNVVLQLTPVLNDVNIAVPVVKQVRLPSSVRRTESVSMEGIVEVSDSGALDWSFRSYLPQGNAMGACGAGQCGSFTPSSGTGNDGSASMVVSGGTHTYTINTEYQAPDLVGTQYLQFKATNSAGVGAQTKFTISVNEQIADAGMGIVIAPSILDFVVERVQDNLTCPQLDCLRMQATVADEKAFSELSAAWGYDAGGRSFSESTLTVDAQDANQGIVEVLMSGYQDSDAGTVTLTATDADGMQSILSFELIANTYPINQVCYTDLGGCNEILDLCSNPVEVTLGIIDDSAKVYVNDQIVVTNGFSGKYTTTQLNEYLTSGENKVRFELTNGPSGYTYAYQLKVGDTILVDEECGVFNSGGCDGNSYAQGVVKIFENTITCESGSSNLSSNDATPAPQNNGSVSQIIEAKASTIVRSGWEAKNVIDGDLSTAWSSYDYQLGGAEWIYVETNNENSIYKVVLFPRIGGNGVPIGFPSDFEIQSSLDAVNWSLIPGQIFTSYTHPIDAEGEEFIFGEPVNSRYIRVYATKLNSDGYYGEGGYSLLFQLGEIYLYQIN
jgi:hypothetical protein